VKIKWFVYFVLYAITTLFIALTLITHGTLDTYPVIWLKAAFTCIVAVGSLWTVKATYYMILSFGYSNQWLRRKRHFAHRPYQPFVSVIIPAWNEEVGLVSTIKTILASSYRHIEIIVVNDGSTDRSDQTMRAFLAKYEAALGESDQYIPIVYRYQQNGGKGSALNRGIALSRGEIIVTFDADCAVHEHAIRHFVSYFADPQIKAISGNIQIGNTKTLLGTLQQLEYMYSFAVKKAEALLGIVFVIGGASAAFRREVFTKLGGFRKGTLTEDMDLTFRLHEAGMKIAYAPEAVIHTEGPTTLAGLLKQRLRWKRGRFEVLQLHRSFFFTRQKRANKLFFWYTLPVILLEDIFSILSAIVTVMLYVFCAMTGDFSMIFATMLVTAIIFVFLLIEEKQYANISYLLAVPISWFLWHFVMFVELNSLLKSLWTLIRGQEVRWQNWQRNGIVE
jgi:cellulose synthase/poly-beta-1,6-N-acetylglucosamine synthase-like glycosyltransferase